MIQSKVLSFLLRYGIAMSIPLLVLWAVDRWWESPLQKVVRTHELAPQRVETIEVPRTIAQKEIVLLKPSQKETKKIEKALGAPLPKNQPLLAVNDIKPLPYGGKTVITLEPVVLDSGQSGEQAVTTVYPNKRPFFEVVNERELGLWYGWDKDLGVVKSAELRWDLIRTGSATWSVKAGAIQFPLGSIEPYAMVGVKIKF